MRDTPACAPDTDIVLTDNDDDDGYHNS